MNKQERNPFGWIQNGVWGGAPPLQAFQQFYSLPSSFKQSVANQLSLLMCSFASYLYIIISEARKDISEHNNSAGGKQALSLF